MLTQKVIFIILVGVLSLTGFSSTKLYDVVMIYERYSAGLETKSITLDFGDSDGSQIKTEPGLKSKTRRKARKRGIQSSKSTDHDPDSHSPPKKRTKTHPIVSSQIPKLESQVFNYISINAFELLRICHKTGF